MIWNDSLKSRKIETNQPALSVCPRSQIQTNLIARLLCELCVPLRHCAKRKSIARNGAKERKAREES
jgi:hypothetical protein